MPILERKPQLDALSAALARARHGIGGIVLVAGEAGAGKSTLVRAFAAERATHARVLVGACDPVLPPRPFAPVQDVAGQLGRLVEDALASGSRAAVLNATIDALSRTGAPPAVFVLEDLHWADEPTLNLLRVLARRIGPMPLLLVGTYRDDEGAAAGTIHQAIEDLPKIFLSEVRIPPLSVSAVTRLAAGTQIDPRTLHAATGGNAFFVSEVIAGDAGVIPRTVVQAVVARSRRLSGKARAVLDAAALLGYPAASGLVAAIARGSIADVDDAVRVGLLVKEDDGTCRFRHELARLAILGDIGEQVQVELHGRALAALRRDPTVDSARLAAHAIGAGSVMDVATLALPAARRAVSLGAHRQAALLFAATTEAIERVRPADPGALCDLLERHADQAVLSDDATAAVRSLRRAVELRAALGDLVGQGVSMRLLSSALWFDGEADEAVEVARAAVELLERVAPRSAELAAALSVYGQRLVVSNTDDVAAMAASRRALGLAESLGLEPVIVHALTTIGSVEANPSRNPSGIEKMEEAFRRAAAAGLVDEATRALINLLETASDLWELDDADRYLARTEAWLEARAPEDFAHRRLLRTRRIQLDLYRGRWDAVVVACEELLQVPGTVTAVRIRALAALGQVLSRRGDPRGTALLEEALAEVPPNEIQDLFPVLTALAEARLEAGDTARARDDAIRAFALGRREGAESAWWWWGHCAFWAWRAGAIERLPDDSPEPYLLHEAGRWREAADAWEALGFAYPQALALAESDDPDDLRRGLRIARRLEAAPLVRTIATRMRSIGVTPGRGRSAASRANPAGLTGRELDVLRHLVVGARNAEIAAALMLSAKTVDHHVSAILQKLGVPNRRAAGAWGQRLGL